MSFPNPFLTAQALMKPDQYGSQWRHNTAQDYALQDQLIFQRNKVLLQIFLAAMTIMRTLTNPKCCGRASFCHPGFARTAVLSLKIRSDR